MTLSFGDDSRKADLSHSSPRGMTLSQPVAVGFIDAWLPPGASVQPSDRGVHIGSRHGAALPLPAHPPGATQMPPEA